MKWFIVVMITLVAVWSSATAKCDFDGVFNFGDSNSDTGGFYAALPPQDPPNGITYFGKPTGRLSDGRLIIDFLAQALGIPFLSPYLKSVRSDFRHGANFAVAGAAVRRKPNEGASLYSLSVQLQQFKQFKLGVEEQSNSSGAPLPGPDIFGKSLYTIYIGQNDFTTPGLTFGSRHMTEYLRSVVSDIANTTKEIYALGGRTFFVFNLAPVGCYPFVLSSNSSVKDPSGCLTPCNDAVVAYNAMLKAALEQARRQLPPDTKLIVVDTHAVLLRIFNYPNQYGFQNATAACRDHGAGGKYCSDPERFVNWDRVHLTEAANRIVADAILSEAYFDPPFPLSDYCDIQPITAS